MKKSSLLVAIVALFVNVPLLPAQRVQRAAIVFEREPMIVDDNRNLEVKGRLVGLRKERRYVVTWVDAVGRLMGALEGTADERGRGSFAFNVGESRTIYHTVSCFQGRSDKPVAEGYFLVPLAEQKWEGFILVALSESEKAAPPTPALLRAAGFRGIVPWPGLKSEEALASDMMLFPILDPPPKPLAVSKDWHEKNAKKYIAAWDVRFLERPVGVYGSREKAIVRRALDELVRQNRSRNPAGFLLGRSLGLVPPNMVFDYDYSASEIRAWRRELEKNSRTPRRLGKTWRETIVRWNGLNPATTVEVVRTNRNRGADGRLNVARWLSFRLHMDRKFSELVASAVKSAETLEPPVRVGLGGPSDLVGFAGMDLPEFLAIGHFAFVGTSRAEQMLYRRGASMRRMLACLEAAGQDAARKLWVAALNRCAGAVVTDPENFGAKGGKEEERNPVAKGFAEASAEITGVVGALLRTARLKRPTVAVYYSRKSQLASFVLDAMEHPEVFPDRLTKTGFDGLTYPAVLAQWGRVLDDLGVPFELMTEFDFATKTFRENPYKIIILPRALVLSDEELKALADFASAGGIVVADAATAVFDGNGVEVKRPQFESLFGLRRDAFKPAELEAAPVRFPVRFVPRRGRSRFKGLLYAIDTKQLIPGELALRTRGASARLLAGKLPGLMFNKVKKGYAIMLNLSTLNYSFRGAADDNTAFRDLLLNLIRALKVERPFAILEHGKYARGYRLWAYELDRADLFAVLPAKGAAKNAAAGGSATGLELLLPEKRYVYDLRSGKMLGYGETVSFTVEPDSPALLAALTYQVRFLRLETFLDGPSLQFDARLVLEGNRKAWRHVFQAELLDGQTILFPPQYVGSVGGLARGNVYFGLGLPTGSYTLRVRDLLTGLEVSRDVVISPRRIAE